MSGILFIVATPIGNLEDISPRALKVLSEVDIIACEDTRHSRSLLSAYGIERPLLPLHQHNERGAAERLISRLQEGANVAFISDAGTPLVSDPGATLTALAHAAGIQISPIPGASSVITALSASGLSADRFQFAGFIPSKAAAREKFLAEFVSSPQTTVFFETPHRIADTLAAMAALFSPARRLVIARELTKQFEQIQALTIGEAQEWLAADSNHGRGEFVLILEKNNDKVAENWQQLAQDLQAAGVSSKDAAAIVAKHTGAAKKSVYQFLISES